MRRSPYIDEAETGGIGVAAADPALRDAVGASLHRGRFLDAATGRYPTVVLGAEAAATLGVDDTGSRVWLGDRWFTVIGILDPVALAPNLDTAALIGFAAAKTYFDLDPNPSTVFVRADQERVEGVRDLLGATANPERPEEVDVSRPSDALEARAAAKTAFTSLFLGLGAVALLVGGVGIANVMVISVLERRSEIGLRRALGATQRHVGTQFLTESLLLACVGWCCRDAARRGGDGGLRGERGVDRGGAVGRFGRGRVGGGRRGWRGRAVPRVARSSVVADGCVAGLREHTVGPRVKQLALRGEPLDPRRPRSVRVSRLHRCAVEPVAPGRPGAERQCDRRASVTRSSERCELRDTDRSCARKT